MKLLLPLISLVAAAGIFFGPTRSALNATTPLTEQRTSLEEALVSAQKIQTVRETLQERYNSFSSSDLARLSKMVPSHVDNVRLVIDINAMASAYGMNLKDIEIGQTVDAIENPAAGTIAGDGAEHRPERGIADASPRFRRAGLFAPLRRPDTVLRNGAYSDSLGRPRRRHALQVDLLVPPERLQRRLYYI